MSFPSIKQTKKCIRRYRLQPVAGRVTWDSRMEVMFDGIWLDSMGFRVKRFAGSIERDTDVSYGPGRPRRPPGPGVVPRKEARDEVSESQCAKGREPKRGPAQKHTKQCTPRRSRKREGRMRWKEGARGEQREERNVRRRVGPAAWKEHGARRRALQDERPREAGQDASLTLVFPGGLQNNRNCIALFSSRNVALPVGNADKKLSSSLET